MWWWLRGVDKEIFFMDTHIKYKKMYIGELQMLSKRY